MINSVTLVGRLTKDPELRYTQKGDAVASFTLAVNRPYKNASGDTEADFISCTIWRKPAENVANYLKKGSLAGVTGRIQTRNFEGQDGKRVYVTEVQADSVQFLEPKSGGQNQNQQQNGQQSRNQGGQQQGYSKPNEDPFAHNDEPLDIDDSDLPF